MQKASFSNTKEKFLKEDEGGHSTDTRHTWEEYTSLYSFNVVAFRLRFFDIVSSIYCINGASKSLGEVFFSTLPLIIFHN